MRETYQIEPGRTVTVTIETSDGPAERLYTAREVGDLQASEAELVAAPLRAEINALKNRVETVGRARREAEEKLAQLPTELDWAAVRAERDAANQRAIRMERKLDQERQRRASELALVEGQRDNALDRTRELERLLALGAAREDALEIRVRGLLGELAGAEGRVQALETKVRNYDQDRHSERDRADKNREWAERAELRVAQMAEEKRDALAGLADQLGKVIGAVHGHEVSTALQRTNYESAWEYQIMAGAIRNVRRVVGSPTPPTVSDETPSQA